MSNIIYNFENQNFVITGASSGMGKQIAIELAEAGAKVLAIARGEEALLSLQKLYPDRIEIACVDVCDSEKLENYVAKYVSKNGKLSGFVHSAGILGLTPIRSYDESLARSIFDTSFWGGIKLVQICTKKKYSMESMSGVLFSSAGGHNAAKGMFSYASAKAALMVAIRSIAKEVCNRGLRLNTVSPGWVDTEMTRNEVESRDVNNIIDKHLLGIGNSNDVSGVVLFLLSDRSKWMTGTDIVIDGGYLA